MDARERFVRTLNFEKCDDRLPLVEWAAWWHLTVERWKTEGLPPEVTWDESLRFFDLDPLVLIGSGAGPDDILPAGVVREVTDEASYEALRPFLYTEAAIAAAVEQARTWQARHERGEIAIRVWLDGYFWFPRKLFGIEEHLLAFYDQPALMHRMNSDLADYNIRVIEAICTVLTPEMVGFAEDMSYNHGPMLSRACFNEFLLPYYRHTVPAIKALGVKVLVDTDGDVTTMIPWLMAAGIEGVYPLEHQAGVDVAELRRRHPKLIMMGGYDKMVMSQGEAPMRAEFERLLPVMRSGGFIPSVDHQTPPEVSLANFQIYMRLFREYCARAVS
ncbi:MAG: uroporphyrinogen decarboxylase family protein [Opitutales bacterium]